MTTSDPSPPDDPELTAVLEWFQSQPDLEQRFGEVLRQAHDEVYDGQRTGRYSLGELSKTEKTYLGTKVEIILRDTFDLPKGGVLDYVIAGAEVDAKYSIRFGGWMIPSEAVGGLCLCMHADERTSTFQVGLIRATEERLRSGSNRDRKRILTPVAMAQMSWVVRDGRLPPNLLFHLEEAARERILKRGLSGQARVNLLFTEVQGVMIRREVVLTVARQQDGPKRVRDARKALEKQGIVILGHQQEHPEMARRMGLPVPRKGEWISVRLTGMGTGPDPTG